VGAEGRVPGLATEKREVAKDMGFLSWLRGKLFRPKSGHADLLLSATFVPAKPIDRWLGLVAIAAGVITWLIPHSAVSVLIGGLLVYALLWHPAWNLWWVERRLWRRVLGQILLVVALALLVRYSWPVQEEAVGHTMQTTAAVEDLAYLDVSIVPLKRIPNQGPAVIYLPTDFDVSNVLHQELPDSYRHPWQSEPIAVRLALRNVGARSWLQYRIHLIARFTMIRGFPLQASDWGKIPHVDDSILLTNCQAGGTFCGAPLGPASLETNTLVVNLSGANAAIIVPQSASVQFAPDAAPTTIPIVVGGINVIKDGRTAFLNPNREGQAKFIR
jgi:hypothetical protein